MATVVTTVGKGIMTARMLGGTPSQVEPKYIGWGTGAGTAAVADTTLFTEVTDTARTSTAGSQVTTTVTNDTHQITGTLTATTARVITNAGVFDAASAGNLYIKGDFASGTLATGESIAFTVKNVIS